MQNATWRYVSLEDGPHLWRRAWHLGWVDRLNGFGWNREYDRMSKAEQIGYEQGRLHVANIISAGTPLPRWDGSKALARDAHRAMADAYAKNGECVPPEFKPPPPQPS